MPSWKEEQRQSCLIPRLGLGEQDRDCRREQVCWARSGQHSFGHTEWTPGDVWVEMPRAVQHLRRAWREEARLRLGLGLTGTTWKVK